MRPRSAWVAFVLVTAACAAPGPDATTAPARSAPPAPVTTVTPGSGQAAPAAPVTGPPAPVGTAEPEVAATPAALARQLETVERSIRDPATPAAELPRLGWTQQVIYRTLVRIPEWRGQVVALLRPDLRPVADAHVAAGDDLRRLAGTPRPELPKWRIVPPAPASELLGYYREAQAEFGVPWPYLAAIHLVETRMGRIRGTSVAGAQGPMQFIPSSWDLYGAGGDINDNRDSILAAGRHLVAGGAPDDMAAALYAYNPSQRYVRAITAYARQMQADERTYFAYYHWQVYYGDVLLPEGYGA